MTILRDAIFSIAVALAIVVGVHMVVWAATRFPVNDPEIATPIEP
jgi:hypothetical protein